MSDDTANWLKKLQGKAKVSFAAELGATEEDKEESSVIRPNLGKRYTSRSLSGLRVDHDLGSFVPGSSEILILKDSSVLDDPGRDAETELVAPRLLEAERARKQRDLARHSKGYSGFKAYEEEELVDGDEDKVIVLGTERTTKRPSLLAKYDEETAGFASDRQTRGFRLGEPVPGIKADSRPAESVSRPVSEDAALFELGSKKRKRDSSRKAAKKIAKTLFADEPEAADEKEEYMEVNGDVVEEDDDRELQRALAASRREKLKDLNGPGEAQTWLAEGGHLGPALAKGRSLDFFLNEAALLPKPEPVALVAEKMLTRESGPAVVADEEVMGRDADADAKAEEHAEGAVALIQEPLVRDGVAATLALLKSRGIKLEVRSYYSPRGAQTLGPEHDIRLEYFDEEGNKLSTKEAYKELSRRFHGKTPGKVKMEKIIRRREEAKKQQQASVSTGDSNLLQNLKLQQQATGSAFVVLSGTRQHSQMPTQTVPLAALPASPSVPVRHGKIFGLQIKK
jgi:U4/U6.U5 tri-snRNP-associated protein 1